MTKRLNLVSAGFARRKDWDFSDDGTYFRCYEYKGLRISVAKYQEEYFVAVAHDEYRSDIKPLFTWDDWFSTEAYKLESEFNGCYEVDVEKLKENCEVIIKTIDELNEKAASEKIDTEKLMECVYREYDMCKEYDAKIKNEFVWFNADEYEFKNMKSDLRSLDFYMNRLRQIMCLNIDKGELRKLVQNVEKYGYAVINKDSIMIEYIDKLIAKSKGE